MIHFELSFVCKFRIIQIDLATVVKLDYVLIYVQTLYATVVILLRQKFSTNENNKSNFGYLVSSSLSSCKKAQQNQYGFSVVRRKRGGADCYDYIKTRLGFYFQGFYRKKNSLFAYNARVMDREQTVDILLPHVCEKIYFQQIPKLVFCIQLKIKLKQLKNISIITIINLQQVFKHCKNTL